MAWQDDHFCFACGDKNPDGLKLDFKVEGEKLIVEYTFPKKFQGYANVVHGGMLSLVLDEVMVNLPWKKYDTPVVSAELNIRLKKPVKVGQKVIFSSWIEKEKGSLVIMSGQAELENGEVVATASAKCLKVDLETIDRELSKR